MILFLRPYFGETIICEGTNCCDNYSTKTHFFVSNSNQYYPVEFFFAKRQNDELTSVIRKENIWLFLEQFHIILKKLS